MPDLTRDPVINAINNGIRRGFEVVVVNGCSARINDVRLCYLDYLGLSARLQAHDTSFSSRAAQVVDHVIIRGNHRQVTFRTAADYQAYLERLSRYLHSVTCGCGVMGAGLSMELWELSEGAVHQ